jgi:4-hydroxy-tetrahydrodipicolinate synthase
MWFSVLKMGGLSMNNELPKGVWPTMVTPFSPDNEVDYRALEQMVEWYIDNGVAGLFTVCLSSEMFSLSDKESVQIARFVVEKAAGRIPVVASGHTADDLQDQVRQINEIAETGIAAVVLNANRFALAGKSDAAWRMSLEKLIGMLPESLPLGLYECPYPFAFHLSLDLLRFCDSLGRFLFFKDTCCDAKALESKIKAAGKVPIYNADSTTLMGSLLAGAAGYSGVMANFHPDLYAWLCANYKTQPQKATWVADFLGTASLIQGHSYPLCAKYHMQLNGIDIELYNRVSQGSLSDRIRLQVEQLYSFTQGFSDLLDNYEGMLKSS